MSQQRNPIIVAVTLALVSAFVLSGVSVALFPSQSNPFAPSEKTPVLLMLSSSSSLPRTLLGGDIFTVFVAKPLDGVCIQSDGSLNSTNAPITRDGDTYRFTDDMVNQTIVIQRDNVVIDGAGHTLQGYRQGALNALEGIHIESRSNVTIENLNVSMFWQGIWIQNGVDIVINNNTISNTNSGLYANSAKNTRITGNNFNNVTTAVGLTNSYGFDPSTHNSISSNIVTDAATGISLSFGSDNSVTANNFANVFDPISAGENATVAQNSMINGIDGIGAESNSIINQNTIVNFTESAIAIGGVGSVVFENYVENCSHVISASENSPLVNNTIWHNNFVNNTGDLLIFANDSQSMVYWDNGKEGNYWSSYNGADANGDGIGDTPYKIDSSNIDRYPLMQLYDSQAASDKTLQAALFGAGGIAAAVGISVLSFSVITQRTVKKKKPAENAEKI